MPRLFTGDARREFPNRQFDRFLDAELAALRAPGAPKRRVFRDAADVNLLLVVGRRGSAFYFKGRSRTDTAGRRKDLMIKLGEPSSLTIAQARAAADEIRTRLSKRDEPETESSRRRAARAAAYGVDAATRQRREQIESLLAPGARTPPASAITALSSATLDECATAYENYGIDMRRIKAPPEILAARQAERANDVMVQLRLAISECGAGGKTPSTLTAGAIDHALRDLTNATARKRVGALRGLYKWLLKHKAVSSNPVDDCEPVPPPQPRERYADDRSENGNAEELKSIWDACDRLSSPRADFLRLLILLPLRRDELADARVSNISTTAGMLHLNVPKTRSKTNSKHSLPLVGEAAAIVARLIREREPDEYLIPLTAKGEKFNSWKSFQEQVKKLSKQDWFYFHSFRKMFSTEAMEHGLEEHAVIDGALNHAASLSIVGSGRSYNFAKLIPRRAELLREWERVVLHNVATGLWPREAPNVVGFDPAARSSK